MRLRDEHVNSVVPAATRKLVTRLGYDRVTTQMIAKKAGVGKQTIDRRWSGKAELVLEAFTSSAQERIDDLLPSGPLARRLCAFLKHTFEALQQSGPTVSSLMATAQRDAVFRQTFKAHFIEPRRRALRRVLIEAQCQTGFADEDWQTRSRA